MMKALDWVRRVSPWWVLAVYVVMASLLLQVVKAAVTGFDLPSWILTVAWVLLLIGLPVVAVTSFIQHGAGTKVAKAKSESAERDDGDAIRRVFTWSNTVVGGLGGFLALAVSAGAWILSGPEAGLSDLGDASAGGPPVAAEASATAGASEAFRSLARSIRAMDVDATLAFYDDDPGFAHVFGSQIVEGRDAFDAQIRNSFAALREIPTWEIEELRATELDPNTVLVVARIREVAVDTSGVRLTIAAVSTNVFVRRSEGWRVSYAHVASDVLEDSTP